MKFLNKNVTGWMIFFIVLLIGSIYQTSKTYQEYQDTLTKYGLNKDTDYTLSESRVPGDCKHYVEYLNKKYASDIPVIFLVFYLIIIFILYKKKN